jgi:hypothetical protein
MSHSLEITALAQPCRAKQLLFGCVEPDPSDGRERLWLTNMNETTGGELISVDFEHDTAEVYNWPTGHGSWHILRVPGDLLVISTYYDGKFVVFDMVSKKFTHVADFPGESYIWDMALGSDGRVYGGTYDGAKLGAVDPQTGEFEDCGNPFDDEGNMYLRHVKNTPAGDIACTYGFAHKRFAIYKVREKQFVTLWEDDDTSPIVSILGHLFVSTGDRGMLALAGEEPWPVEQPPLPDCPVEGGWTGLHRFSTDERVFLSTKEHGMWKWSPKSDTLDMIFNAKVAGRIWGVTEDDRVLGIRGQDYWVSTSVGSIEIRAIPVELQGRPMHFLSAGAGTRIWGGPPFGQTVCWYETDTGDYHNTGQIINSSGEVYGAVEVDDKLYTASYSGADFAVFDPEQPWDQINNVNPRHIASIVEHGLCRPVGRMKLGRDGMLYSGWQAEYGRYGGAFVRLDPNTEKITVWSDPLGPEAIAAFALDDKYAYLGSNHSANGLPTKDGDGSFGVFDLVADEMVYRVKMDGDPSVRPMGTFIGADGHRLVIVPLGDSARVFDADEMEFRDPLDVPTPESPGDGEDMLNTPDGGLLYIRKNWLVKITPELTVEHYGPLPWNVEHMTYGSDDLLYVCSGPTLYRVDGV